MILLKILLNVEKTGVLGSDIAKELESKYKVVVEKYEAGNILFIVTLQNTLYDVKETASRFMNVLIP